MGYIRNKTSEQTKMNIEDFEGNPIEPILKLNLASFLIFHHYMFGNLYYD